MKRTAVSLFLTAFVLLATAGTASAHTKLESSDPAEGASLEAAPTQLTLRFSELVKVETSKVTVTGPNASEWQVGQLAAKGPVLTVPVTPAGPAGEYAVNYEVTSADGHSVNGTTRFTLTKEATPAGAAPSSAPAVPNTPTQAQAPAPAPTVDGQPAEAVQVTGAPWWLFFLGAAVLVVIGVGVAFAIVRKRS
ncbi:copper resistance CopC family protein [Amycolatopsis sp. 195334CR]|uniref:copper resistance CopC family protein n=1 Tax=Amycolatopsis sp. 195334CR TaxID=2814588 RepID=UPI001A8FB54A|nr:copper resistance CopC family protein [Amycolatopsis sp. 195334CR]MBN6033813.1 copper resistance protein CopC [Amycolatopsis sp. 195334CR]